MMISVFKIKKYHNHTESRHLNCFRIKGRKKKNGSGKKYRSVRKEKRNTDQIKMKKMNGQVTMEDQN